MAQLVDIFLQPSKVFAEQRERPTFLVPFLVFATLTIAFTLAYFFRVDPSWYGDHMFDASRGAMTAKDMARAKSMMPSTHTMGVLGAVGGIVTVALMFAIFGLYYWLASKITGRSLTYKHGLGLTAWSSMPAVLGSIVALVGALTMAPQTGLESLMLTHVDPLLISIPSGQPGHRLAQTADLLQIWTTFLTALGWRVLTRASWMQSAVIALIPLVVVYGIVAVLPG
ncbi:YIP1 family protein [Cognatilysobacter lacus]|nr:YIP1 family protein [Lysobacter lacus]